MDPRRFGSKAILGALEAARAETSFYSLCGQNPTNGRPSRGLSISSFDAKPAARASVEGKSSDLQQLSSFDSDLQTPNGNQAWGRPLCSLLLAFSNKSD